MTEAADLLVINAEIHTLDDAGVVEAVAIRDGRVVKVGDEQSVGLLDGVDTVVIDAEGATVLPGFIDAHTHLRSTGRYLVHADLSNARGREDIVERLSDDRAVHGDWRIGVGYDESTWQERSLLTREDLDAVSESDPVAAFRVDMHTASINSVALELIGDDLPEEYVEIVNGRPTGVIVEDALSVVHAAIGGESLTHELLTTAQQHALELGITCIHDMVRGSTVPRAYRDLELADELLLRVRLNYWRNHFDAVRELGLSTNHGSDRLTVGAIKSFSDGSLGGRTAKVSEPYEDGDGTGTWVVDPDTLKDLVDAVEAADYQVTIHAIGDVAIDETLTAIERADDPGAARHRIEHVELATDDHIERLADSGIIASMQPNFHQWSEPGGLYESRLGERYDETNRLRDMYDAGVHLALGSDSMPMGPLYGIHCAVNAPFECQRLTVDEAIEAYTIGGAYAGFDEEKLGRLAPGYAGDLIILNRSPWEAPDAIEDIEVTHTVIEGELVYQRA